MKKFKTFTLPVLWGPALVNGDWSGLGDEEARALEGWLDKENPGICAGVEVDSKNRFDIEPHDAWRHWPFVGETEKFIFQEY